MLLHPVGIGSRWVDRRGPCACPRAGTILLLHHAIPPNRVATRTGTRPPHPLHPSPCPYSRPGRFSSPIRVSNIIRTRPHSIPCFDHHNSSADNLGLFYHINRTRQGKS